MRIWNADMPDMMISGHDVPLSGIEPENLLDIAESRYWMKVYDSLCDVKTRTEPLPVRMALVGRAIMERADFEGYCIGVRLLRTAERMGYTPC